MKFQRAFTLTEVLVVTAILAVLAAVLFPVFRTAQSAAKSTKCIARFGQIGIATFLYSSDYDDRLMPSSWLPVGTEEPGSKNATWVQISLPYLKEFGLTRCPEDYTRPANSLPIFDPNLTPQAVEQRLFEASLRSNAGYNASYLAPLLRVAGGTNYLPVPRSLSQATSPAQTLLMVDSVWEVDAKGQPSGGGRYVVTPPCRFFKAADGSLRDSFAVVDSEKDLYVDNAGWDPEGGSRATGSAFGWHRGMATTLRLDGSVKAYSIAQLRAGCNFEPNWRGSIKDPESYIWDLQ